MIFRRKYEFKPDSENKNLLQRLQLTRQQRRGLLKWLLYTLLLIFISVVQDVFLSQLRNGLGATTDLVPCAIILVCVQIGADRGAIFALVAAMLYKFSGSAPGYYSMALIPVLALMTAMLRQSYFRRSFGSVALCVTAAVVLYEMLVFACGLIFVNTVPFRAVRFLLTGLLSALAIPVIYPITNAIEKIGEKSWKD